MHMKIKVRIYPSADYLVDVLLALSISEFQAKTNNLVIEIALNHDYMHFAPFYLSYRKGSR